MCSVFQLEDWRVIPHPTPPPVTSPLPFLRSVSFSVVFTGSCYPSLRVSVSLRSRCWYCILQCLLALPKLSLCDVRSWTVSLLFVTVWWRRTCGWVWLLLHMYPPWILIFLLAHTHLAFSKLINMLPKSSSWCLLLTFLGTQLLLFNVSLKPTVFSEDLGSLVLWLLLPDNSEKGLYL